MLRGCATAPSTIAPSTRAPPNSFHASMVSARNSAEAANAVTGMAAVVRPASHVSTSVVRDTKAKGRTRWPTAHTICQATRSIGKPQQRQTASRAAPAERRSPTRPYWRQAPAEGVDRAAPTACQATRSLPRTIPPPGSAGSRTGSPCRAARRWPGRAQGPQPQARRPRPAASSVCRA